MANTIRQELFALQDLKYKDFQAKLIPSVDPKRVIGVRTPALRELAKKLSGSPEAAAFLNSLPHEYYDENNLHGFLIERMKDFDEAMAAIDAFLPYVDNWATCDLMSPKVFKKRLPELYDKALLWIASGETYTVRFGIEMLMSFFLDEHFKPEIFDIVSAIVSEEYYINMMIAWFFATALAKQYDAALPYIEGKRMAPWVHNKTIQKAVESYRITDEQKARLRALKVKAQG